MWLSFWQKRNGSHGQDWWKDAAYYQSPGRLAGLRNHVPLHIFCTCFAINYLRSKTHLYFYLVHKNRSKNKCQLSHCVHHLQLTFTTWYVDPNALEFVIVPAHGGCYVYCFTSHPVVSITAIGSCVVDSVSIMYVCSISYNRWFVFTGYLCQKMYIDHVHSLNMYRHIQVVTGAPLLVYYIYK